MGCKSKSNLGNGENDMTYNDYEPEPQHNTEPGVFDLVIDDLEERDELGKIRYGTRLQPNNGRDALIDLYQELLDAVVYLRQLLYEKYGA